jgi:hypothetical protein
MPQRLRSRTKPDRISNPAHARDPKAAASWACTLPLDREVARIEAKWGSLDAWLSHAPDDYRGRFAGVWQRLNVAIDRYDLEALENATQNALKGIKAIDGHLSSQGIKPPEVTYVAGSGIIVTSDSDDAARVAAYMPPGTKVFSTQEIALILEAHDKHNMLGRAKEMGATVEAVHTIEEPDDEIPF